MSPDNLIHTKLFTPPRRRNLLSRSRLQEKLDSGKSPDVRLTLVSAPAGFGKTSLVSEWAQSPSSGEDAFAWLALDDEDNDANRFWRYIAAALQTVDSRVGESILPVLSAPQPVSYRTVVAAIVDDILGTDARFTLILDDYHVINNEVIHEGISYLLDKLPASAHVLITTRADPHLQLARRRGRGELCEVRARDLRFTLEESAQFLNAIMDLDLSTQDVDALEKRTEGWIAGLQMAAISLLGTSDRHGFVAEFHGNDRYIADYLVEEVLQRQPAEIRQFLLQTSILDRLSGSLCDAVTGRLDSQAILADLESSDMFLVPMDNHREWFRYHQLFADLLQRRLSASVEPDGVEALKLRSAGWYAAHGYTVEAASTYMSCGDLERAVEVIEGAGSSLFVTGELNTLVKWSEMIPEVLMAVRPRLSIMAAWGCQATGHPQQSAHLIDLLEREIGTTTDELLGDAPRSRSLTPLQRASLLEAAVVQSRLAVDSLDLERAASMGEQLLPHLVPGLPDDVIAFNNLYEYRGPVLLILGLVHKFRGELGEAATLMAEAAREGEQASNPHIVALALGHLGEIRALQGEPDRAEATFERALAQAQVFSPNSSAFWGMASVGLASLAFDRNDLVEAEAHLETGLESGKIWHVWECLLPGCTCQARLHQAYGEWDRAEESLDELAELTASNLQAVGPALEANRALLALRRGDLDRASEWVDYFDAHGSSPYPLQWEENALIAARIWAGTSRLDEAGDLLARLSLRASSMGHGRLATEIQLVQASLEVRRGDEATARQVVLQALESASSPGYLRMFLDEGMPMRVLLEGSVSLVDRPDLLKHAELILGSFAQSAAKRPTPTERTAPTREMGLIEPLSDRELEVLGLMAEGLSNPAIAERLYLTANTVRTHARNIYGKLEVHSRMEAVNKAREIGLLDQS